MWENNLRIHQVKIHKVEKLQCMIPECKYATLDDVKMQLHLMRKHGAIYEEDQHALVCYK